MESIIFVVLLIATVILLYSLLRMREQYKSIERNLAELSGTVSNKFFEQHSLVDRRLGETTQNLFSLASSIKDISLSQQEITKLKEEILSLNSILTIPKLRGGMGEMLLEDIIANYLPSNTWQRQYTFQGGQTVDMRIDLPSGNALCIDAKFPLEKYRASLQATTDDETSRLFSEFARDVKKHIQSISAKYILPEEKTLPFALMYIPSEKIYYDIVALHEQAGLLEYAFEKNVIPVSPAILYSYIHILILGFKGMQIEEKAGEILRSLSHVEKDVHQLQIEYDKLGKHLHNASSTYTQTKEQLVKTGRRIQALSERENLSQPSQKHSVEEQIEVTSLH